MRAARAAGFTFLYSFTRLASRLAIFQSYSYFIHSSTVPVAIFQPLQFKSPRSVLLQLELQFNFRVQAGPFVSFIMLRGTFREGEAVQAVDETNGLWYAAKILAFESDHSARIQWTGFSKCSTVVIAIPERLQNTRGQEFWHIRKPTSRELTRHHRVKPTPISYNPRQCERNQMVILMHPFQVTIST